MAVICRPKKTLILPFFRLPKKSITMASMLSQSELFSYLWFCSVFQVWWCSTFFGGFFDVNCVSVSHLLF